MAASINFSRAFAKKLLILSIGVGVLIASIMPVTYYILTSAERAHNAALRCEIVADNVAQGIQDNEELWYYDIPRFIEIGHRLPAADKILAVRVYDQMNRLLFEENLGGYKQLSLIAKVPIRYNSEVYGYLEIQESKMDLLITSGLALIFFGLFGGFLGTLIYRYPLNIVVKSERTIIDVVNELKESQEHLWELSITDAKTKLFNASYLMAALAEGIEQAELSGRPLQLMMLDLDYFKQYNDTLGHVAGDVVLCEVADLLLATMDKSITVGRFGGEEFLIILPDTDAKTGGEIAHQLLAIVASHHFPGEEVLPGGKLSVSIGIASFEAGISSSEFINMSDKAMYMAKEAGRNRVGTFEAGDILVNGNKMIRIGDLAFSSHTFKELMNVIEAAEQEITLDSNIESMIVLLKTLDGRESSTAQHSFLVNKIAMAMGRKLLLPEKELLQLHWGTLLHDIGKLGISDAILLKPFALTREEYETIKRHPIVGYDMVKSNEYLNTAAKIILFHHERWDGGGYPQGLSGDQIPLMARICSIADTVAALVEGRPYRREVAIEYIVRELQYHAAKQFDPELVDLFISMRFTSEMLFEEKCLAV